MLIVGTGRGSDVKDGRLRGCEVTSLQLQLQLQFGDRILRRNSVAGGGGGGLRGRGPWRAPNSAVRFTCTKEHLGRTELECATGEGGGGGRRRLTRIDRAWRCVACGRGFEYHGRRSLAPAKAGPSPPCFAHHAWPGLAWPRTATFGRPFRAAAPSNGWGEGRRAGWAFHAACILQPIAISRLIAAHNTTYTCRWGPLHQGTGSGDILDLPSSAVYYLLSYPPLLLRGV